MILGGRQILVGLVEGERRRALVKRREQLPLVYMLPHLHVHVRQGAAGLEVHVQVGACLDVAGTRHGRLHHALLRGDDLRRGAR